MKPDAEKVVVRLKPGQERRALAGHLWLFSNELASVEGDAEPGRLAYVYAAGGRFLGVAFHNPLSLIACRMLAFEPVDIDAEFFRKRLAAARDLRERLRPGAAAYRLCFGESDGLPGLVIDRYGSVFVLQILAAGMERRLPLIAEALHALFAPSAVLLKNDHRARALEGLKAECRAFSGAVPATVEIEQDGLRLVTPLGEGQKTGFYFDQADNRVFLKPYFFGRTVVDLYSYTGAFAVTAARSGAKAVLAIDSSEAAVALARENAAGNGVEAVVQAEEDDAEAVLRSLAEQRQPFKPDMILLDPPSFAPSKKHLTSALRGYGKLNSLALRALPKGGLLATSTCSHHVTREIFVGMLRLSQAKAQRPTRLLALRGQAADHPILLAMPETEYLHFALLEVL